LNRKKRKKEEIFKLLKKNAGIEVYEILLIALVLDASFLIDDILVIEKNLLMSPVTFFLCMYGG